MESCMDSDVLEQRRRLISKFFMEFMAFDYACKILGCYKERDGKITGIMWGKVKQRFNNDEFLSLDLNREEADAKQYYLKKPPKTLMSDFSWKSLVKNNANDIEFLIDCLVQVRNNLFHGSKCQMAGEEWIRNEELLKYGITLIGILQKLDPDISVKIEEALSSIY